MAIHHDKKAYGKLAPLSESSSERQLVKMAEILSHSEDEEKRLQKQECGKSDEDDKE